MKPDTKKPRAHVVVGRPSARRSNTPLAIGRNGHKFVETLLTNLTSLSGVCRGIQNNAR